MQSEKTATTILILSLLVILFIGYYLLFLKIDIYYTQIDNSKYNGYSYQITAYNKHGHEKELELKINHELTNKIYLKLTITGTKGITNYEFINYNQIPKTVINKISKS